MKKNVIVCLLLLTGLSLGAGEVKAQEIVPEILVIDPVESQIETRPSLNEQIQDIREQYRGYLEEYRTDDRQYQIANGQYLQLGTLASLEAAVTTTRRAMLSRIKVLETYLILLRLQTADATGINLETKETTLVRIDAMLAELALHRQRIESASDRNSVVGLSADFESLAPHIEDVAYQAQTYLAIGRLQTVYDKAITLSTDIHQTATSSNELKQAEKDRAYAEIQSTLGTVNTNIDKTEARLAAQTQTFSRSNFTNTARELGAVYAGLSQTVSFLSELLRL